MTFILAGINFFWAGFMTWLAVLQFKSTRKRQQLDRELEAAQTAYIREIVMHTHTLQQIRINRGPSMPVA